jgi:hypothetical protein
MARERPATQTVIPPDVTTPGENARDNWKGVFSMYSAVCAEVESNMASNTAVVRLIWGS